MDGDHVGKANIGDDFLFAYALKRLAEMYFSVLEALPVFETSAYSIVAYKKICAEHNGVHSEKPTIRTCLESCSVNLYPYAWFTTDHSVIIPVQVSILKKLSSLAFRVRSVVRLLFAC